VTLVDAGTGEIQTLADCERVIERGMQTFVEVGEALAVIRDGRLYRETHETFEAYCHERWGFTRTYAHRLVDAAEVAAMLPNGNKPENEGQARELRPLRDKPEAMVEAMSAAKEKAEANGSKVTAETIREEVRERTTTETQPTASQKAADTFAERHPDYEYRKNANTARSKAYHLLDLDPERIAAVAVPDTHDSWRSLASRLHDFASQLEAAFAPGLKAVK